MNDDSKNLASSQYLRFPFLTLRLLAFRAMLPLPIRTRETIITLTGSTIWICPWA
jgi:hypothetical protein